MTKEITHKRKKIDPKIPFYTLFEGRTEISDKDFKTTRKRAINPHP